MGVLKIRPGTCRRRPQAVGTTIPRFSARRDPSGRFHRSFPVHALAPHKEAHSPLLPLSAFDFQSPIASVGEEPVAARARPPPGHCREPP